MNPENIPLGLRALDQWVCATGAKDRTGKVPLNPRTGQAASVTDPTTWGTYQEAIGCAYPIIGFVLTADDPFTIIDLDEPRSEENAARHRRLIDQIDSYQETSISGRGIHIIVEGSIPRGVRRDQVEVYSSERYMICTGQIFRNFPVTNQQPALDSLFAEMNGDGARPTAELVQIDSPIPDDEIRQTAAAHNEKFTRLFAGDWKSEYPSQSEADFALLNIIAFFTRDNAQAHRIFKLSALGQRKKATPRYIDRGLSKIRAEQPPLIDLTELLAARSSPAPVPAPIEFPPGFVGDLADWIQSSAIRPVREISLAAAIGFTAGICGRGWNISGTGLNQYLIVLAGTGTGKEGAATAIESMRSAVARGCPTIEQFMGPGHYASGQAVLRILDSKPCFISVLGEFGVQLQQLASPTANNAELMLKRVLLDVFGKSGITNFIRPSVYSDSEKNTAGTQAPAVTILGEGTPSSFYDCLTVDHVAQGLIPRFLIFNYFGPRPPVNPNPFTSPPADLVERCIDLVELATTAGSNLTMRPVGANPNAARLLKEFDLLCDEKINSSHGDAMAQIWNRAHLKALKLAALVAVGQKPETPKINAENANWAIQLVQTDANQLTAKLEGGQFGSGDARLAAEILRVMQHNRELSPAQRINRNVPKRLADHPLVPLSAMRWETRRLSSFTKHPRGSTAALDSTLASLVKSEEISQVAPEIALAEFQIRQPIYTLPG